MVGLLHIHMTKSLSLCSCDDSFSGASCQPDYSPSSFKEEFENTLESNHWPVVSGGSTEPGSVSSGNALVFNGVSLL